MRLAKWPPAAKRLFISTVIVQSSRSKFLLVVRVRVIRVRVGVGVGIMAVVGVGGGGGGCWVEGL